MTDIATDPETAAPETETVASETGAADRKSRLRRALRPKPLLVLALVVVLLGVVGYLGTQLRQQQAAAEARTTALDAARTYATDLSTYDFNNLDRNFAAVTANSHGQFAEQYKQISGSLTELIKQNQAVSQGSVLSAGIVEADQNRAVVALFVDQQITNVNNPQPRIDRNRMQMTLVNVDDRWLIDDIKLL
jgi:Mce-associated membrane protein